MMEGSGSLTNGSGSERPKNIWILRIRVRIRNTVTTSKKTYRNVYGSHPHWLPLASSVTGIKQNLTLARICAQVSTRLGTFNSYSNVKYVCSCSVVSHLSIQLANHPIEPSLDQLINQITHCKDLCPGELLTMRVLSALQCQVQSTETTFILEAGSGSATQAKSASSLLVASQPIAPSLNQLINLITFLHGSVFR